MLDWHQTFLATPAVHGALIGLATAASVDLLALKVANSWGEFFAAFNWKVASFMWMKGILFGAISGAGLNALFGL